MHQGFADVSGQELGNLEEYRLARGQTDGICHAIILTLAMARGLEAGEES